MNYSEGIISINCRYCGHRSVCGGNLTDCTKYQILQEAVAMQEFLESKPEADSPVAMVERLSDVNVYIARSGALLAQARFIQDTETAEVFNVEGARINGMATTMANKFVSSQTADSNGLVTMLDRQNRAFVHQGENLRTQISFAKQEVELQRRGY